MSIVYIYNIFTYIRSFMLNDEMDVPNRFLAGIVLIIDHV